MGPVIKPLVGRPESLSATGEGPLDRRAPAMSAVRRASSFVSSQPGPTGMTAGRPGRTQERPVRVPLAAPVPSGERSLSRASVLAAVAGARGVAALPVNRGRFRNASAAYDTRLAAYPLDASFERGYETAVGQLFAGYPFGFGGYRGNPFDDAIPDDNETGGDTNGGGDGEGGGNDDGQNPPPPPDQGDDTPPPPPDGGPPGRRYSFLLIGDFEEVDSKSKVFRSYRDADGAFVIEDKVKVNPFPGTVGGGNLLFPAENQLLFSDDVDGDGRLDLLFTEKADQGTILHLLLGGPSGGYPQHASTFFVWQAISSMGLLDFDGDRELDVAVLFRNASTLSVYSTKGGEFKYLKEIVLPFEPSVVVDSQFEGLPAERRLHVFDASFYRVATLTSGNPAYFLHGLSGGRAFKSYKLDAEIDGPGETELQVFEEGGGIALAEKRGGSWVVLGRFSTTDHYPFVVFGDYLNTGTRQLICLP